MKTAILIIAGVFTICGAGLYHDLQKLKGQPAELTWYKAKDHTVAANPRHQIPDGAYIQFTNRSVVPNSVVIVRKRGHMNPTAVADFDLCPEAFTQLAPLSEGRLKQVDWKIVYP